MLDLSKKNGYEHLETILSLTFFDRSYLDLAKSNWA